MTNLYAERACFDLLWFHCSFFGFYVRGTNRGLELAMASMSAAAQRQEGGV